MSDVNEAQKPQATEALVVPAAKTEAKPAEQVVKPQNYILVRHLGRSATSRRIRADRAGYRRQRFMLSDGQRIRRQNARTTEFGHSVFIKDFSRFIEGVTVGMIEVIDPVSLRPISLVDLPEYAGKIAAGLKMDLVIDKERQALVKEYGYLHGIEGMAPEQEKPAAEEGTPEVLEPVAPPEAPETPEEPAEEPAATTETSKEEVKVEEPKEEPKAEEPKVEEPKAKAEEPKVEEAPAKHKGRRSR